MSENPPSYSNYPRPEAQYGSTDRLQALADGYFRLNIVFIINIAVVLASNGVARAVGGSTIWIFAAIIFVLIGALTYAPNKQIAYGKGWPENRANIASVLMGLNSALCCGIIGYIVMQNLALSEMKLYGIRSSTFGLKKKAVQEIIDSRNSSNLA